MFKSLTNFFKSLPDANPLPTTPANLTSPDQLISAHIIESFARDFKSWSADEGFNLPKVGTKHSWRHTAEEKINRSLARRDRDSKGLFQKEIKILFQLVPQVKSTIENYSSVFYQTGFEYNCTVNGVRIASSEGEKIFKAYVKLRDQIKQAEKVAAEALARQKAGEAKWNLAEELLKIKRDGNGRIVFLNPEKDQPPPEAERPAITAEI